MLRIVDLKTMDYEEALSLQKQLQQLRIDGHCEDTLLLLEHPPVITKGIRGKEEHILVSRETLSEKGIQVFESNRGGDVTYLGPGQMIGYIIMDTSRRNRDIRKFVANIEQAIMNILLNKYSIESYVGEKKYTGVFVEKNKIAAIGIAVNHRVTMHGFALNMSTNLSHFEYIVPCGLYDRGVTSIQQLTGRSVSRETMIHDISSEFERLFDTQTYMMDKELLLAKTQSTFNEVYNNETRVVENQRYCS